MASRAPLVFVTCTLALTPSCNTAEDAAPTTRPASAQGEQFTPPVARSVGERVEDRRWMVQRQIAEPRDGRDPVTDPAIIAAMLAVPRHAFVPRSSQGSAYDDMPLPIGHGQTISQPYIVALMTQHLAVRPTSRVLEIGTGSGYQAAVLAQLTPHVYTIEIVEPLARQAEKTLKEQGYDSVRVKVGDGYRGWPEHAPFDGIIVTCAPEDLPSALWEQLAPGGRIVIPIGRQDAIQRLVVISKTPDGQRRTQMITEVRFVPMTGGK